MRITDDVRVPARRRALRSAALAFTATLAAAAPAAASGTWALGPDMTADRATFATAPTGSSTLIAGGHPVTGPAATTSAEVVGPGPTLTATGAMGTARTLHEAAPLPGGRVLVAGGAVTEVGGSPALASAEIWDPGTGMFTATGAMSAGRQAFALAPLADGRVLATGGSAATKSGAGQASADLFDPNTGVWTPTGPPLAGRLGHSATGLPGGQVLIVGDNPTAEIYNPATGTFSPAGTEPAQRSYHTATLLQDGRVLVAGGVSAGNVPLDTANLWDPATGAFTPTGPMTSPHSQAAAALLPDGRVVVAGGFGAGFQATNAVDVYDPLTNQWTAGTGMPYTTRDPLALTLPDGRALVMGGALSGTFSGKSTALYTAGARVLPAPAPAPSPVPPVPVPFPNAPAPGPAAGKFPAKLKVQRASIRDGELDVLASITNRANGDEVEIEFNANGTKTRFKEKVKDGRLKFTRDLKGKQRRVRTGIITYTYEGNDLVRPTEVRLRAANGKARLERGDLSLTNGRLSADGKISSRARGVVRLIFTWNAADGSTGEFQMRAKIEDGEWSAAGTVPAGARAGGYLSIQFTGDLERRMRGEQTAKQVLAG